MNDVNVFFGTTTVRRCGNSQVIYMSLTWPLKKGEIVDLTIRRADFSDEPIRNTKKISMCGSSMIIYVNKLWGYSVGDMVSFCVEKRGCPKIDRDEYPHGKLIE